MNTQTVLRGALFAAVSSIALAFPAMAQTDQSRLDALEAQIGALQSELETLKAERASAPAASTDAETPQTNVELRPGPRFSSADGAFTFRPRGRIELDTAIFDADGADFNSGTQLRRARLGVEGRIASVFGYRFEVDLANAGRDDGGEEVAIQDAYFQYVGIENLTLTLGQHKTPNSLERLASSPNLLFLERAIPVETFTNASDAGGDRRVGISAAYAGENWTVSAGYFGEPVNISGASGNDEGSGLHGRVTFAPVDTETRLIHVGLSGYARDTAGRRTVRFRDRPEVRVDNRRIVDTGAIAADGYDFIGLEGIAAFGPVFATGEYTVTSVDRIGAGLGDVTFDGFYVSGGWFLTGERLPYADGVIDRVRPNNPFEPGKGLGAFALTARYSTIDLNDAEIAGGEADIITAGLNWYPNQYLRVLFDFSHFDSSRNGVDLDGNVGALRVAADW
jgi:phosphate-selective porin OprO/OprP